ncbi:hypothetical protein AB0C29_02880 [Actinoplanes sp. NPDC048791]|uniref:hypothetical protein n=1 Tax=Actinoplanes sp. NPDC048791 TaxID=3154623 RepID=UPI0033CA136B
MSRAVLGPFARRLHLRLAEQGFEADRYVFRRWSPAGDAVLVELKPRKALDDETRFHLNLALVLAPVLRWDRTRLGLRDDALPKTENGIWTLRVEPPGDDAFDWEIPTPDHADEIFDALAAQLDPKLPGLLRLLDHDQLRTVTKDRAVLGYATRNVAGWLLAEEAGGATPGLRAALFGDEDPDDPEAEGRIPMARPIWQWAASGEPWGARP